MSLLILKKFLPITLTVSAFPASLGRKDMIDQSIPNAETYGTGLWHGYGQIPSGNKGIFIALEESFKTSGESSILDESGEEIGSLIEVCGFRTEVSRIGEVADESHYDSFCR